MTTLRLQHIRLGLPLELPITSQIGPSPVQALSTEQGVSFGTISPSKRDFANSWQSPGSSIRDIFEAVDPIAVP